MTSEGVSQTFECLSGVRQGENLSPFLFSIFLNDVESFLDHNNIQGVSKESTIDGLRVYLKLFILLYADDTVIFSETIDGLQKMIDSVDIYSREYE